MVLIAVLMISLPSFSSIAAQANVVFTLPVEVTEFSIELRANENTPFAGIEFELSISDENALDFKSFEPVDSGFQAPITPENGLYAFGFGSGSNTYSRGDIRVCTIKFDVKPDGFKAGQQVRIEIVKMTVNRANENKEMIPTEKQYPDVFIIQRAGINENEDPTHFLVRFFLNGGIRTGGGELEQWVPRDGAAVAPTVSRAGWDFIGWNTNAFNEVAAPTDVTAMWSGGSGGSFGGGTTPGQDDEPGDGPGDPAVPLDPFFPFTDVIEGIWFYGNVRYMWENGLMNGTSETLFSPYGLVTRGMVVTVLYRMEGEPDITGLVNPFDDVADGMYYTKAVTWAADEGIVLGYSDTKYGPNDNVTREQLAAILHRYQQSTEKIPSDVNEPIEFPDDSDISEYAVIPVKTLVMQGIINGRDNGLFDPKGNANRAEFAAMLHRYLQAIEETAEN